MAPTQAKVFSHSLTWGVRRVEFRAIRETGKWKGCILERREQRRRSPKICFNLTCMGGLHGAWKRRWLKAETIELKFSFIHYRKDRAWRHSPKLIAQQTKFFGGKLAGSRISIMSSIMAIIEWLCDSLSREWQSIEIIPGWLRCWNHHIRTLKQTW